MIILQILLIVLLVYTVFFALLWVVFFFIRWIKNRRFLRTVYLTSGMYPRTRRTSLLSDLAIESAKERRENDER